jgi:two-component system chemotaxis response regulator CheY
MISSEGSESFIQQAMDCGANGYVTKPFTPESIKQRLEGLLG